MMSYDRGGTFPVVDELSDDGVGPCSCVYTTSSLANGVTAKLETPVGMAVFGSVSASLSAVSSDSS